MGWSRYRIPGGGKVTEPPLRTQSSNFQRTHEAQRGQGTRLRGTAQEGMGGGLETASLGARPRVLGGESGHSDPRVSGQKSLYSRQHPASGFYRWRSTGPEPTKVPWLGRKGTQVPARHKSPHRAHVKYTSTNHSFLFFLNFYFFIFFSFLGLHPQHMEVSRLQVESDLQLLAYTTAMAIPDPRHICNLHCSWPPCWILTH